ncbi:DUF6777 domain-containing protein [Gordonia sp. CPCC 206044]|uniref:DUF6777 domain-containing protein n=1 Tax=Gordonia sp. CPCC 206044 TaxID=3140793 RepID=UPI003AF33716
MARQGRSTTVHARPGMRGFGAIVAAVLVLAMAGCMKDAGSDTESHEVALESATSQGESPWTESVADPVDPAKIVTLDATVTGAAGQGRTTDGAAVGIYGGSDDQTICDTDQLVGFLNANPDKAAAWREVLGVSDIGGYVATLRPVVLLRDTVVTDHGYEDGQATAFTALLQADTAVLVDPDWVPRVRCASGSPLTPTTVALDNATYTGQRWANWEQHQVVLPPKSTDGSGTTGSSETSGPSGSAPSVGSSLPMPPSGAQNPEDPQDGSQAPQPGTDGDNTAPDEDNGQTPPDEGNTDPGTGDTGNQLPGGEGDMNNGGGTEIEPQVGVDEAPPTQNP